MTKALLIIVSLFYIMWGRLLAVYPDQKCSYERLCGEGSKRYNRQWSRLSNYDRREIERFKELYQKHIGKLQPYAHLTESYKIPKVLHFIWLGPKAFPEASKRNIHSWFEHNPGWEIHFWTDSKERPLPDTRMKRRLVQAYDFSPLQRHLNRTSNYGEKSDIMRYVILQREGGVYIDHDVLCCASFDNIHKALDFYCFLENVHYHDGLNSSVFPGNCLIGSKPQHPIMQRVIDHVVRCWDEVERKFPGNDRYNSIQRVLHRTFDSFARGTKELIGRGNTTDVLFPTAMLFSPKLFNGSDRAKMTQRGCVFAIHEFASTWTSN